MSANPSPTFAEQVAASALECARERHLNTLKFLSIRRSIRRQYIARLLLILIGVVAFALLVAIAVPPQDPSRFVTAGMIVATGTQILLAIRE